VTKSTLLGIIVDLVRPRIEALGYTVGDKQVCTRSYGDLQAWVVFTCSQESDLRLTEVSLDFVVASLASKSVIWSGDVSSIIPMRHVYWWPVIHGRDDVTELVVEDVAACIEHFGVVAMESIIDHPESADDSSSTDLYDKAGSHTMSEARAIFEQAARWTSQEVVSYLNSSDAVKRGAAVSRTAKLTSINVESRKQLLIGVAARESDARIRERALVSLALCGEDSDIISALQSAAMEDSHLAVRRRARYLLALFRSNASWMDLRDGSVAEDWDGLGSLGWPIRARETYWMHRGDVPR
jgi:hypothetical protein